VNKLNRDGQVVERAQIKENESCVKLFQKGRLVGTVEDCLTADSRGKVQQAKGRTVADDLRLCAWLDPPPPFGYTGAATVNDAAVAGAIDLIHVVFGNPVDNALLTANEDRETAACQTAMLKQADRLEDTVLRELNNAKRRFIAQPAVDSAEALETALAWVFAANENIASRENQLYIQVDRSCAALQDPPSTVFPGACADADLGVVEDCVIDAARCVACSKMNAFDGLALDCDQLDNQALDGSCARPAR
jgi:hypothetical protein